MHPYRECVIEEPVHSATHAGPLCGGTNGDGGFIAATHVDRITCDKCKRMIAERRVGIDWREVLEELLISMVERDEDDLAWRIKRTATWLVNNGVTDQRIRLLAE